MPGGKPLREHFQSFVPPGGEDAPRPRGGEGLCESFADPCARASHETDPATQFRHRSGSPSLAASTVRRTRSNASCAVISLTQERERLPRSYLRAHRLVGVTTAI